MLTNPFITPADIIDAAIDRRLYPELLQNVHEHSTRGTAARKALLELEEAKPPGADTPFKQICQRFAQFDRSYINRKTAVDICNEALCLPSVNGEALGTVEPDETLIGVLSTKKKNNRKPKKNRAASKPEQPTVEARSEEVAPGHESKDETAGESGIAVVTEVAGPLSRRSIHEPTSMEGPEASEPDIHQE
ncbi:Nn.00g010500.m01.CDS01 [Neocucurbitaria sp. VM-36]